MKRKEEAFPAADPAGQRPGAENGMGRGLARTAAQLGNGGRMGGEWGGTRTGAGPVGTPRVLKAPLRDRAPLPGSRGPQGLPRREVS